MWARQLPPAWPCIPACEYNSSCRTKDQELGHNFKSNVRLNVYGYIISTVIGCWFLAGRSSSCLGTGCLYRQTLATTSHYVNSNAPPTICKIGKCNDSVQMPCTCSTSSNTTCCIRTAAKPKFRVKERSSHVVLVYLLNVKFDHSFGLHRFSSFGKFYLFEFCLHTFHLSRFLLKYFKYFKGSGVRI